MSTEQKPEGWGWPANSRKPHYFYGGRSLCGAWGYFGELEKGRNDHPDNCKACARRLVEWKTGFVCKPPAARSGGEP